MYSEQSLEELNECIEFAESLVLEWVNGGYEQVVVPGNGEFYGPNPYLTVRPKPKDDAINQELDRGSGLLMPEIHFWRKNTLSIVRAYPIQYEAAEFCTDADPSLLAGLDLGAIGLRLIEQWIAEGEYTCCDTYGYDNWSGKVYAHDEHGLRPRVTLWLDEECKGSVIYAPRWYDCRFVGRFEQNKEGE